jgi:hypothetical protein
MAVPDPALSRGGVACSGLGRRLCSPYTLAGLSGRTSPVSMLCGTQLSWRPSRDFPVLAAVFRTALRSRPTAPLFAARVPLREATACFYPVFLPDPLLHRSPGFAPGPATCRGRWAWPPLRRWVVSHPDFVGLTKRSHQTSPESRGCRGKNRFYGEKFHRFKTAVKLVQRSDFYIVRVRIGWALRPSP